MSDKFMRRRVPTRRCLRLSVNTDIISLESFSERRVFLFHVFYILAKA